MGGLSMLLGIFLCLFVAIALLGSAASAATIWTTWTDNSSNETKFELERAPGAGGSFAKVREIGPNPPGPTRIEDRLLPSNTTFRYRVRAVNNDGASGYSNIVTVNSGDRPAPLVAPEDRTINKGESSGPISFTIWDDATNNYGGLSITAASSNPTLTPAALIVLGGTGPNRTITITPAANQTGAATITLTVSDGVASVSDTFVLTVIDPVPSAPTGLQGGSLQ